MAVHGKIASITEDNSNLIIELTEAENNDPVGQPELIIENYTIIPDIGDRVWGGADEIRIESIKQLVYKRIGFTRLVEKHK